MFNTFGRKVAALAGSLFLTSIGVALGCGPNYCDTNVSGCEATECVIEDVCCRDSDEDGQSHCIVCDRRMFYCFDNGWPSAIYGPPNSCYDAGELCC
jgi:hypothetical protein